MSDTLGKPPPTLRALQPEKLTTPADPSALYRRLVALSLTRLPSRTTQAELAAIGFLLQDGRVTLRRVRELVTEYAASDAVEQDATMIWVRLWRLVAGETVTSIESRPRPLSMLSADELSAAAVESAAVYGEALAWLLRNDALGAEAMRRVLPAEVRACLETAVVEAGA